MSSPDPRAEITEYVSEQVDSILQVISIQREHINIAIEIMTPEQQAEFFKKVRD